MRTLSTLVIAAAIFALSVTAAPNPTEETLPNVPPVRETVSTDEMTTDEVVEMRNWRDTATKTQSVATSKFRPPPPPPPKKKK